MNQTIFGSTIANQRKRKKLTQAALANILNVSDKTISKWENGLGYPEVSMIPKLAEALDVNIDYLFTGERSGIAVIGNLHADYFKHADDEPWKHNLANIVSVSRFAGGCIPNITFNLARIDPTIPLEGIGCVGDDDNGRYLLTRLQRYLIKTSQILTTGEPTGTDEMIFAPDGTGYLFRTFGANALLDPSAIDIPSLSCRIAHFGRPSLFSAFWEPDIECGSKLARVLRDMKSAGIYTSISVMANMPTPCLEDMIPIFQNCSYVMMDATHLCEICAPETELLRPDSDPVLFRKLMQKILDYGVSEKVFVFNKYSAGFCLSKNGHFSSARLRELSSNDDTRSRGLSDDLCSGCLYGLYHSYLDIDILNFACGVAAASLLTYGSDDGMRPKKEILQIINEQLVP